MKTVNFKPIKEFKPQKIHVCFICGKEITGEVAYKEYQNTPFFGYKAKKFCKDCVESGKLKKFTGNSNQTTLSA